LDKALQDYTEAVREGGAFESACNGLAWFLATVDDARYRNSKRAIEYASRACDLSGWSNGDYFDTLAAAHAEAGNFKLATQWEAKVIELMKSGAQKPSDADLKRTEQRLELYRAGKPYREHIKSRTAVRDRG
jgi:serine/threonine-protein kinase